MNIITKLNNLITKNFNKFLKNYFNNMNYIDNNYDVNYIKEINFMGDCANWIKEFPKSN